MGLGTANAVGRIGATLVPFLVSPGESQGVTFIVFGSLTLAGGFLVWLLPETLNMSPNNTIEEGEMFNKKFGGFRCRRKEDNNNEETNTLLKE